MIAGEIAGETFNFDKTFLYIAAYIFRAEPTLNRVSLVDLLIGAEHFLDLQIVGVLELNKGNTVLQKSKLRFISWPLSMSNIDV